MSRWIYLSDLAPTGTVVSLETGELRKIMSSAVAGKAPAGLRRYVLEELPGGRFAETGEVLPLTESLADDIEDVYTTPNSWIYDWPNLACEMQGDEDLEHRDLILTRLNKMMAQHPYDFKVTALQRRFLMYFSDGNYTSQQRFDRLIPAPGNPPFRRNSELRSKYEFIWNSIMRDAKVPFPKDKEGQLGNLRPCLYLGPSWVVRFTLDDHDVLMDRCRVYVDDAANFICSDWCQRHDHSSYNNGINLQQGLYTFDGWATGPCLVRNVDAGFKPKSAEFKRVAVRTLMKAGGAHTLKPVAFEEAFAKAQAGISKYSKVVAETPAQPQVDAGPITLDAMAEASALSSQIWKDKAAAALEAAGKLAPSELKGRASSTTAGQNAVAPKYHRIGDTTVALIPITYDAAGGTHALVSYTEVDPVGDPYVATRFFRYCSENLQLTLEVAESELDGHDPVPGDGFAIVDDNIFYMDDDNAWGDEPLSEDWWMYSAALFYRDHLNGTSLNKILGVA